MLHFTDEIDGRQVLGLIHPRPRDGYLPVAVLHDSEGRPILYRWPNAWDEIADFLIRTTYGKLGAYITPFTFRVPKGEKARRVNAVAGFCRCFWLDIEGTIEKGGYDGAQAVLDALNAFVAAVGLIPTFVVLTGSGGLHAYFVVDTELTPEDWRPRVSALIRVCDKAGLRYDSNVFDTPRIMRAVGSIHQKYDTKVRAFRTGEVYPLDALDKTVTYVPGESLGRTTGNGNRPRLAIASRFDSGALAINADIQPKCRTFSMQEAAKHCAAIRKAIHKDGALTPYQPWLMALLTAKNSVEGEDYAHQISSGHADYNEWEVEQKLAGLTGGPAVCDSWHRAWGADSPCPGCLYGGI